MRYHKHFLALTVIGFATICLAQTSDRFGYIPRNAAVNAVIVRPWPGENYPALPSLPSQLQENILAELETPAIRSAYNKMDAKRPNEEWFKGLEELESNKAVWCILSCLCHPHDDVQIRALRTLEKLNDQRAVPFLITYAEYMAVFETGSESATLHAGIQMTTAETLSKLTGVSVKVIGQDVSSLKKGIRLWHKWLSEREIDDVQVRVQPRPQ